MVCESSDGWGRDEDLSSHFSETRMICQRSGRCCISMMVVIRIGDRAKLKPDGVQCPHLSYDGLDAKCSVHNETWYKDSPCFVYGNPDKDPDYAHTRRSPCRIGEMFRKPENLDNHIYMNVNAVRA